MRTGGNTMGRFWTHFSIDPDTKNKGRKALFTPDTCENCNKPVLGANSVWCYNSAASLRREKVVEMPWAEYSQLEELGYSDVLQMAVCPECYDKAQNEANQIDLTPEPEKTYTQAEYDELLNQIWHLQNKVAECRRFINDMGRNMVIKGDELIRENKFLQPSKATLTPVGGK
jgi:hypothetical protein